MLTRVTSLALALGLALTTVTVANAAEPGPDGKLVCTKEDPCRLRIRTVAPKASPWGVLMTKLTKAIKKETDGRIKPKVYWQSKSEPSAVRQCINGKVGGVAVSNGALSSAVPAMIATEIPFLFDDYAQADKAMKAAEPLMKEIMAKHGFIFGIRGENGFRHFASTNELLDDPAKLAGKSMRSQPAKHHVAMYKALSASPKPIQVAQVASSMSAGTVAGYDNTLLFGDLAGWADNVRYVALSAHIYQGAVVAWCKPWFDTLPDDLKATLTKTRPKIEKIGLELVRAFNDKKMPKKYAKPVAEGGHSAQVVALTKAQRDAFKAKTAGVEATMRPELGADGVKLLDLLKANR